METMKFTVSKEVEVTEEMVKDVLCCGFEGGVGYWCQISGYKFPIGLNRKNVEFPHIDLPVLEGGGVKCQDACKEENDGEEEFPETILDLEKVKYGLGLLMSGKDKNGKDLQPQHRYNFLNENTDSETGDVFIQLALFGEIVFG